ncbi:MAG TPA: hypothetical protein VGN39_07765 [Terriglobales bacterium]|jgi:hypothetical protein|nr:hypothetical protein [Terriglobales bacterium]
MTLVIFLVFSVSGNLTRMIQANGTKLMGQQMDSGTVPKIKKSLIEHLAAITDVFGDDRGLLKVLLTFSDEELAGVHKFSQAYKNGDFPIDVMIEPGPPYEKSGIFP